HEIEILELMAADLSKRIESGRNQRNKSKTEQKLKESEERYRTVLNALSEGIVVQDLNDAILMCNNSAASILGLTKDQLLGKDSYDPRWKALKPDGSPIRPEEHPSVFTGTTGQPVNGFLMSVYKNEGERVIISINSEPIHDDQGNMYGVVASFTDVTKEKQALTSLAKSEEDLRITLNSIGDGVISTDKYGRIVRLNQIAEELTGWKKEEALGLPIDEVFHIISTKTGQSIRPPVKQVLEEGKMVGLANHTLLLSKDNKEFQIANSAAPIIDAQGEIMGVVMVFRDVTAEYAIQEALIASEERYKKLTEAAPVGIIVHIEGEIIYHNSFASRITEAPRQSLLGYKALDVLQSTSKEIASSRFRQLLTGEVPFSDPIEETILSLRGKEKVVLVSGMQIVYKGQAAILNVFTDITKLKSTERALIKSQERISNIANSVPGLLFQYKLNPDGSDEVLYVNDQSEAVWGISKEEVLRDVSQVWANILEEDVAATQASVQQSAQELSFWDQKYRIYTNNGQLNHFLVRFSIHKQADGFSHFIVI
ncbi:MAG: PAS domain S-box protein, partial [Bacteroidota bacterium]